MNVSETKPLEGLASSGSGCGRIIATTSPVYHARQSTVKHETELQRARRLGEHYASRRDYRRSAYWLDRFYQLRRAQGGTQ